MIWILKGIYFVCPFLAFGSLAWFLFGDVGWWAMLLFPFFGFLGLFAGGAATALEEKSRDTFTYIANDPQSLARAAFHEVEASGEVPGLHLIRDEVISMLKDAERVRFTLVEDKVSPRNLAYLLISNVANEKLCSGAYHVYRGVLNASGKELMAAFRVASEKLVFGGYQSAADHQKDIESLKKEISEIG